LAHSCRGFSPWLFVQVAFGPLLSETVHHSSRKRGERREEREEEEGGGGGGRVEEKREKRLGSQYSFLFLFFLWYWGLNSGSTR
jgi:hypothetical protein